MVRPLPNGRLEHIRRSSQATTALTFICVIICTLHFILIYLPKQNISFDQATDALLKLDEMVKNMEIEGSHNDTIEFGDYHLHSNIAEDCNFLSWGNGEDISFEKMLAEKYSCKGRVFDATMLYDTTTIDENGNVSFSNDDITHTPVETFLKSKLNHIHIFKINCEGCEYEFSNEVEEKMPHFFKVVSLFIVKVHTPKHWAKRKEDVINLGKLFYRVFESGMQLIYADEEHCGQCDSENYGKCKLIPEMEIYSFGTTWTCRKFLFAKPTQNE